MADLKRRIIAEFSAKNKAKGEMAGFRKDMDSTGQAMKRMATGALAVAGMGGGIYAVKRAFDYVTKAAMKQEDALFLLSAALKTSGEYSYGTMKGFEAFAASIQQATVYGDEEVLSLMQLMKSLGVTSNKLEQATRMAIGLAAATGRDVRSMSMYIALAQQGEFTMLRRYIPALRKTTDATEQLRIITEFAARGFKIAEAQAETASGAIAQMKNAYSDVAEVIGDSFLPSIKEISKRQKAFLEENQSALRNYLTLVAEGAEMLDTFSRKILGYTPPALIYKAITKPEEKKPGIAKPKIGPLSELEISDLIMERNRARSEELYTILQKQAEQQKMMDEHRMEMLEKGGTREEMEYRQSVERIRLKMEAESKAAKEINEIDREMWLEREERAYHAMRAPIIAAEELAAESAERRKRIAEDIAMAMASSWTNAIDQMMFEGKKFWDAMEDMARSLIRTIAQIIIYKKLAEPFAYGIMGLPLPGTMAAPTAMPGQSIAPSGLPYWPAGSLQYGGTVERTGWAKVHKGETFSGINGGGEKSIDVHIHNEQGEDREISHVEQYVVSDQRIIDVFTRRAQTDGPLRRSIKQAAR